jgi:hypothetical protein
MSPEDRKESFVRVPFAPCCREHFETQISRWPSFDDLVDWPEGGEEPLYRYFTICRGVLYELTATDPALTYSIYKLPETSEGERELVKQLPWEGEDQRAKLAELRAIFPSLL